MTSMTMLPSTVALFGRTSGALVHFSGSPSTNCSIVSSNTPPRNWRVIDGTDEVASSQPITSYFIYIAHMKSHEIPKEIPKRNPKSFHMKSQRKILGVRWQDHVTKVCIQKRTGLSHVGNLIQARRHGWRPLRPHCPTTFDRPM